MLAAETSRTEKVGTEGAITDVERIRHASRRAPCTRETGHADAASSCIHKKQKRPGSFVPASFQEERVDDRFWARACRVRWCRDDQPVLSSWPTPRPALARHVWPPLVGIRSLPSLSVALAGSDRRTTRESARRTPLGTTRAPAYYLSVLRALLHSPPLWPRLSAARLRRDRVRPPVRVRDPRWSSQSEKTPTRTRRSPCLGFGQIQASLTRHLIGVYSLRRRSPRAHVLVENLREHGSMAHPILRVHPRQRSCGKARRLGAAAWARTQAL